MSEYICTICGYEGRPRRPKRGSRGTEVFIWAVLLFPGPLYSLYRRIGLPSICPNCQANAMVSPRSDKGKLARHKFESELGELVVKEPESMSDAVLASEEKRSEPMGDAQEEWTTKEQAPERPKRVIDPDEW